MSNRYKVTWNDGIMHECCGASIKEAIEGRWDHNGKGTQIVKVELIKPDNVTIVRDALHKMYGIADQTIETAVRELVKQGNKIPAIRLVRGLSNVELKEAKDYVDSL